MKPVIYGMAGATLTTDEAAFFRDADPVGYILFKRNVESREQLRALTDQLRALHGRDDLMILIDQEGGRVQRMQPPEWPQFPAAGGPFGALYGTAPMTAIEAARANAEAIALTLNEVGITVDCLPLLDLRQPEADNIIGDRSFGNDAMMVAALGRAVLDGLEAGGCLGVIKHMPGHGRALVDTHLKLPIVEASAEELETDIAPFRALADTPLGMTAHIVFTAWDAERPATLSPIVIEEVIRGKIGFDGLLMTDDIDMKALSGTAGEKAAGAIGAGCDVVLDCWGRMDEMVDIANSIPALSAKGEERLARALSHRKRAEADLSRMAQLTAKRDTLLAVA
jgi:beta-N-acetylhexosaminidase